MSCAVRFKFILKTRWKVGKFQSLISSIVEHDIGNVETTGQNRYLAPFMPNYYDGGRIVTYNEDEIINLYDFGCLNFVNCKLLIFRKKCLA